MAKKTENISSTKVRTKSCRIAYTLNETQPVICTYISDQPFFYMDEEILEDEPLLFEEGDVSYLFEEELAAMKSKVNAYDRFSLDFKQSRDSAIQNFIAQSALFGEGLKIDATVLEEQLEILSNSRTAQAYLDFAEEKGITIEVSPHAEFVLYDSKAKTILINPNLEKATLTLALIRALRQCWQDEQGALTHPLSFHPDHAILVNRAQLADLSIAQIRVSWELKLANSNACWAHIENSEFADLGRAFAREALTDFRTLNNGKAASAVFETWFLSDRCSHHDKVLIQKMLSDQQGYVFDQDGGVQFVSIEFINKLGMQPFGKNYLAAYAQNIIHDPVFTDVRDRSNANFLWFIKFERSFNEVEQQLQLDPHDPDLDQKRDIHHAFFNNQEQSNGRTEQKAAPEELNCFDQEDTCYETRCDSNVILLDFARQNTRSGDCSEHLT
ncbi:MAG: DUF6782 family putative metallopeptidase [Pseudomonadota bacterium]